MDGIPPSKRIKLIQDPGEIRPEISSTDSQGRDVSKRDELNSLTGKGLNDSSSSIDSGLGSSSSSIGSRNISHFPTPPADPHTLRISTMLGSSNLSQVHSLVSSSGQNSGLAFKSAAPVEGDCDQIENWIMEALDEASKLAKEATLKHAYSVINTSNSSPPSPPSPVISSAAESMDALKRSNHERELLAHQQVGTHPNIVQCFGEFSIEGRQGLVLEEINGPSLDEVVSILAHTYHLVSADNPTNEDRVTPPKEYWGCTQRLAFQACNAVAYMHKQGLIHCDLKPNNLMLHSSPQSPSDVSSQNPEHSLKLIDLGLASEDGSVTSIGHELYAAPEALLEKTQGQDSKITAKLDSYALGMLLNNIFTSCFPENSAKKPESRTKAHIDAFIKTGGHFKDTPLPEKPPSVPALISEDQLSASREVLKDDHSTMERVELFCDLVNKLTDSDPHQRLSVIESVEHPFFKTELISFENFNKILSELPDRKEQVISRAIDAFSQDYPIR